MRFSQLLLLAMLPVVALAQLGPPSREYIRLNGRVIAIESPPPAQPPGVTVAVSPATASLAAGQAQQFTATVSGTSNTAVTWTLDPADSGTVSSSGLYKAPAVIAGRPPARVIATSVADNAKSASATVSFYGSATSGDFPVFGTFINFYRALTPELWAKEFQYMRDVQMDIVIVVSVGHLRTYTGDPLGYGLAPDGLLYPSQWVPTAERPTTDRLEMILSLADANNMKVYLGSLQTEQDWGTGLEFAALREYNKRVATEILQRYGGHPSLRGWYFTQEIWMNWVKYYGPSYYGTGLLRDFTADMRQINSSKPVITSTVFKKDPYYSMPGLTPAELQTAATGFLQTSQIDVLMPQDGAGAEAGAPPLSELPSYFSALQAAQAAAGNRTALWSITETFRADPNLTSDRYPPADVLRMDTQVNSIRPYVSGFVSWIFGNDMSPQATYYPVEASELNRKYRSRFRPAQYPNWSVLPLVSYQFSPQPSPYYPDSPSVPKLSNRTGGGYNGYSLAEWVGFPVEQTGGIVEITADLGMSRQIESVRALTQSWAASGIYHPSSMGVQVSQDGSNWVALGTTNDFPSNTADFAVMWGGVQGEATARYVKWRFAHTGWLFLSELEVLGAAGPETPPDISVTISPASASLNAGGTQLFTAPVSGTSNGAVTWSLSPAVGTVENGLYTAPSSLSGGQTVTVQAASVADPSKYARAAVNLMPNVAPPPQVGPMNPDQGSGLSHLFSFEARAGTGSLDWVQIAFSPSGGLTPTNACLIWYKYSDDTAYLSADNATPEVYAWVGGGALGTPGLSMSNSQCTLDYQNSWVSKAGNKATLNLSIRFAPTWTGTKNVYMAAQDAAAMVAWPYVGYWVVE